MFDRNRLCNRPVRIETASRAKYDGVIEDTDDKGVLFIPDDKHFHPVYVMYTDIRKVIFVD